ncbi:MAG: hypothetical protein WCK89_14385 [bacterium]
MPEQGLNDRLLTRSEVAAIMRVTTRAVYLWSRQGILRPVRLPGRKQNLGYLASEVQKLLTGKV